MVLLDFLIEHKFVTGYFLLLLIIGMVIFGQIYIIPGMTSERYFKYMFDYYITALIITNVYLAIGFKLEHENVMDGLMAFFAINASLTGFIWFCSAGCALNFLS